MIRYIGPWRRSLGAVFCFCIVILATVGAFAQGAIQQLGPVVPGHLPMWNGNGRQMDAGGSPGLGQAPQNNTNSGTLPTGLGIVNSGQGYCDYTGYASSPYSSFCWGFSSNGYAVLDVEGVGQTPGGLQFIVNGVPTVIPGSITGIPISSTNAALEALSTGTYSSVMRAGFYVRGDSPAVIYTASTSTCSLNTGAGDNGSQVPSADGKCWLADLQGIKPTPQIWGAVGNGSADDTVPVQAAINALQNATLYTGPHLYKLTSGVSSSGKISIVGEYANDNTTSKGGFRAGALNLNLITMNAGNSLARDLYIDMGASGTNTSGATFVATGGANSKFADNTILQPCGAFEIANAGWVEIDHNQTLGARGSGCNIIRVGHTSTLANTVGPRIINNTWSIDNTNPSGACMLVEDAGGVYYRNNDCVFSAIGIYIHPGLNQQVLWGFYQGVLGDTSANVGLDVDTSDPSAEIKGNDFDQAWTASAANSCVILRNNGGGTVSGIHFRGHRSYGCGLNGIDIGGGVTYTSITDSNICGNSTQGANAASGVSVGAGVSLVSVRDSTISNTCDGFSGGQAYALSFLGTNGSISIQNNYLDGNNLGPIITTNPLTASSRLEGNVGLNPIGVSPITPGSSPWTLIASPTPTSYYFTGGTVSSITQGGQTLATSSPAQITLGPNESVVVTYSVVPTVVQSAH
jgi:hypothetical protein